VLVRHLCEQGLDAQGFTTEYGDDEEEVAVASDSGEDAS
jgi:putative mRNA 3-end processing factor